MRIAKFILLAASIFAVQACSYIGLGEDEEVIASQPVQSAPLAPIASQTGQISKPRPNPNDRNYTAPYPKLSTQMPAVAASGVAPQPKIVQRPDGTGAGLIRESRTIEIAIPKGALTTDEFLGKKKRYSFVNSETAPEEEEKIDPNSVLSKAMNLPPKEIDEDKYQTFRRIEDDVLHDTRKIRGKIAEFLFPEMNDVVEKPKGKKQPAVYCYKSMAESTCYSTPIEGQEFRRVGKPLEGFEG